MVDALFDVKDHVFDLNFIIEGTHVVAFHFVGDALWVVGGGMVAESTKRRGQSENRSSQVAVQKLL